MKLHIIHTNSKMILSKEEYDSWRDIQSSYPDYMASLGPWSADEVLDYLRDEHPNLSPVAEVQINELLISDIQFKELTFEP